MQVSAGELPGHGRPSSKRRVQDRPVPSLSRMPKSEKTLRAYNYRLGFFLDFTAQNDLRYLDQVDRKQLLRYVKFLRDHESDLDDRTVHNVFETLNTFLRTRTFSSLAKSLRNSTMLKSRPSHITKQELKAMFAAMDEEEKLLYGLFL